MAAGLACLRLGATSRISKGLLRRVPGRMEVLTQLRFRYAHNGMAWKTATQFIWNPSNRGHFTVLGSTGNKGGAVAKTLVCFLRGASGSSASSQRMIPTMKIFENRWRRLVTSSRAWKSQIAKSHFNWPWQQPTSLKMPSLSPERSWLLNRQWRKKKNIQVMPPSLNTLS